MDKQIKNVVIDFNSFSEKFLEDGYIVKSALNDNNLYRIRKKIVEITCDILKINYPQNEEIFLNSFHKFIDKDKINDLRLLIYNSLNSLPWFKALYYSIGENFVKSLVGNELVIQKRVNLSIQLPKDDSSLLPVHSDVWSGCSTCGPDNNGSICSVNSWLSSKLTFGPVGGKTAEAGCGCKLFEIGGILVITGGLSIFPLAKSLAMVPIILR